MAGGRGKAGRTGDRTVRLRVSPGGYEFGDPTGCLCLLTSLTPRGRPGAELGPRSVPCGSAPTRRRGWLCALAVSGNDKCHRVTAPAAGLEGSCLDGPGC